MCRRLRQSDYTGEVEVTADMRITDRNNATAPGGGTEAATVTDSTLAFVAPCTVTAGTGRCELLARHVRERDSLPA